MFRVALLLLFSFNSCNFQESAESALFETIIVNNNSNITTTSYKVVGIKDGDTITLLIDGKEQTVRLAHIDCPEKKQPFGTKAKQFTSDIAFGKYVTLEYNQKRKYDRNKRLIAEVILNDGTNLNKELVKAGLAWHYSQYSDSEEYKELQNTARLNKIGLWSDEDPIAPWDFRKPKKNQTDKNKS